MMTRISNAVGWSGRVHHTIAGFRRHLLTYAAAFVVVMAAGAGTLIESRSHQRPQPPSGALPAAGSDPISALAPAAAPSAAPAALQAVSSEPNVSATPRSEPPFPQLSGVSLYYLGGSGVHILGVGGSRDVPYRGTVGQCGLSVSPDGTRLAWSSPGGGDLIVTNVHGSRDRTVATGVDCRGGGRIHLWSPDSQRLLFYPQDATERRQVDITTGTVSDTPFADAVYIAFSPNGQFAAYEQDGDIVVARASDGSVVRRIAHHDELVPPGFSVQGISDDGRYAVAGVDASDPGTLRFGHQVVDTLTGADVALPGAGGTNPFAIAVYPLPAGNWLVRHKSDVVLTIVSPGAEVVGYVTEPFELSQIGWLRVVPT